MEEVDFVLAGGGGAWVTRGSTPDSVAIWRAETSLTSWKHGFDAEAPSWTMSWLGPQRAWEATMSAGRSVAGRGGQEDWWAAT